MLLRSSSTPVLGSLLSSISESPNNSHHLPEVPNAKGSPYVNQNYSKFSYSKHAGSPNLTKSLYNSSPGSPADLPRSGFRRAQSEGNLESLGSATAASDNSDEFNFSNPPKICARRRHSSTLESIPSFSFYNLKKLCSEDEHSDEEEDDLKSQKFIMENTNLLHDSFNSLDSFGFKTKDDVNSGLEQEMYLARGLGVSEGNFVCNGSGGGEGGYGCIPVAYDGDDNGLGLEEHYKRLIEENPNNPLYLRNYAQFLHQVSFSSTEIL